jgi:FKBP-type peptidyl-prolyl cis-trans isomerase FklB
MKTTVKLLIVGLALIAYPCYIYFNDDLTITSTKEPETEIEEESYSYGIYIGSQLIEQGFDSLDVNALAKGCSDVLAGDSLDISEEDGMQLLNEFFGKLQAKKQAQAGAEAAQAGADYLAKNAAKEGVITTASGLQYEIMNSGSGAKPTTTDKVTVHYHGMLTDGTVFDSSKDRGPFTFSLNPGPGEQGVIPGWNEAVQLMSVGDKWRLTIPSNLAYGERGAPGSPIGPNATLVFEVELLGIN